MLPSARSVLEIHRMGIVSRRRAFDVASPAERHAMFEETRAFIAARLRPSR